MTAMGSPRVRRTTQQLQRAITSGRWPVNTKIPNEAELAAELGVGRSTIREAVRSLAHLGMLEPAPGRGTFVRSLNPVRGVLADFAAEHSWPDILAVRRALEVQAAALAARRADQAGIERLRAAHALDTENGSPAECLRSPGQFHATIIELAENQLLAELYSGLMSVLRKGLRSGAVRNGLDDARRRRDHEALLAAISANNPTAAAALAASHADEDLVVA